MKKGRKGMKKITCLLLSIVMAATMLAGCGNQSTKKESTVQKAEPQTEQKEENNEKEKVVVACCVICFRRWSLNLFWLPTQRIIIAFARIMMICPTF